MKVQTYNWEYFVRGRRWYINFATFFVFFILVLIFTNSFGWVVVIFLLLWWYLLFSLTMTAKIYITILENWIKIWEKKYSFSNIDGFVLEIEWESEYLKNIVFVMWNTKLIHTFADENENIKNFLFELDKYLPLLENYNQTFLDKMARTFKL